MCITQKRNSIITALLSLSILFMAMIANGQSVAIKIPITVSDNQGHSLTMNIGVHPLATYCQDTDTLKNFSDYGWILEAGCPPLPPVDTIFDARLTDPRGYNPDCMDLGLFDCIHQFSDTNQIDTFRVDFQNSHGYPFKISWGPPGLRTFCDSLRMTDALALPFFVFNINMFNQSSYTITSTGTKSVLIWMFGPKLPPNPPMAPTLNSPANNSTDQSLNAVLNWTSSLGATKYKVDLSTDSIFRTYLVSDTLTGTSKQLNALQQNTKYFWHVAGINDYGQGWFGEPPYRFTTLLNPPGTPVLDSPATGSVNLPTNPKFRWSKMPYATSYHLQIAMDQGFTNIVRDSSSLTDTLKQVTGLSNCATYYWHVLASNRSGSSAYSSANNFTVSKAVPVIPTLSSPAPNAVGVPINPTTLTWTGDFCANSYTLQLKKGDSAGVAIFDGVVSGTSQQINDLEQLTDYYWRVKAKGDQDSSNFSWYRKFTTILLPPVAPVLFSPPPGVDTVTQNAVLMWFSTPLTISYYVQVSLDQNFTQIVFLDSNISDTVKQLSGLWNCTRYYWRVRGYNAAGWGQFSAARSFKVIQVVANPPQLISPPDDKDSVTYLPVLTWTTSEPCSKMFRLQVAKDVSFESSTRVFDDTTANRSKQIGPLSRDTDYYWRVRDSNSTGASVWSDTFHFKTTPYVPPGIPVQVSPADGQEGILMTPTLQWTADIMAEKFRLQAATDTISAPLIDDTTITATSRQISVQHSTTYYWRVNARNGAGTSAFTPWWKFITLFPPSVPVLDTPRNGESNVSLSPAFSWTQTLRADVYQIQVSKTSDFRDIDLVFNDSTVITTTTNLPQPLKSYVKYYWKVRAKNATGWGQWSQISYFVTIPIYPAEWVIPIAVKETGPTPADTVHFGISPNATACIDDSLGEYELWPVDFGMFDVRFAGPACLGEGLNLDLIKFSNFFQTDTMYIKFQVSMLGTYPVRFSWPQSLAGILCDSMILMDHFGGSFVRIRMDQNSSISVSNQSISTLMIVIFGPKPYPENVKPPQVELPKGFALYPNYPNPFNPTTTIRFSTETEANIKITVFDILGREIAEITNNVYFPGIYSIIWDGRDSNGNQMPTGVYYVKMTGSGSSNAVRVNNVYHAVRKILLMK